MKLVFKTVTSTPNWPPNFRENEVITAWDDDVTVVAETDESVKDNVTGW